MTDTDKVIKAEARLVQAYPRDFDSRNYVAMRPSGIFEVVIDGKVDWTTRNQEEAEQHYNKAKGLPNG